VFVGWFSLIVLYTAVTSSEKVAGLLGLTTKGLKRISDPSVPLIPDVAGIEDSGSSSATYRDNSSAAVYGQYGGQYIGGTFVPNPAPTDPRGGPKDSKS
jgi:hypothetical protein